MSITFATNCWEEDWEYLLKEGLLEQMIDNCHYKFDCKILCIGNVADIKKVEPYAQKKVDAGVIDRYIILRDNAEQVLDFYEIDKDSFNGGYNYSIAPLTAIYFSNTDLFLFFTGDSRLEPDNDGWIEKASSMLLDSKDYFVANPLWNRCIDELKSESLSETEDWAVGFGFSDQCFLVRTVDFRKPIYNEKHPASERFPKHAGDSFEKRVNSYMHNHNLYRLTSKKISYLNQNFRERKQSFLMMVKLLLKKLK